ncbi:MAG: ribonuclease III [Bacteroidota bacterium]|nr:ribonuclease III [Bacteroidota bacterium]
MNWFLRLFSSTKNREERFISEIEKITGLPVGEPSLYEKAFRHSSASPVRDKNKTSSNQRLEFLGDAILGMLIAEELYHRYPEKDEGFLTTMRSKMVSRKNLNRVGQRLGLESMVESKLDRFKPAKSLSGDALEALIGAIYLDHGLDQARSFLRKRIIQTHMDLKRVEKEVVSYKSRIIEWAQKEKKTFSFIEIDAWGKKHQMTFKMGLEISGTMIAEGEGPSKKRAEEDAARKAFDKLVP